MRQEPTESGTADVTDAGDAADAGDVATDVRPEDPSPPPSASRPPKRRRLSPWVEYPLLAAVALVLAFLIKTFLVQAFLIPSGSMQNTLQEDDRVLVDKLTPWFGSEPDRGEVVVFRDPADWLAGHELKPPSTTQKVLGFVGLMPAAGEQHLIKRVVGVAGDTVECQGTGPVKLNGKPLDEPYVYEGNTPCSTDAGGQFKITVPAGHLWVMGDHRQHSQDSRYHQNDGRGGMVPLTDVVGRAIVVAWPLPNWSTLPVPDTFENQD
ncbi:signal peptidase I [Streptomyces sp. NRRL F-5727]|uniref:signal peptidase I n=1 Tax=Streptomyces sp. NRRL F-5727 TaxID=1463871 RepID=UPI00099E1895|nr:signal peptidase I [Streptomyces sp. NRRL F-5727]